MNFEPPNSRSYIRRSIDDSISYCLPVHRQELLILLRRYWPDSQSSSHLKRRLAYHRHQVSSLQQGLVKKIILSRPAVEAGERLGFLPGDMREKVDPYLRPLYDSLYDLLDFEKIQKKIEVGDIEIAPLAFMRGRTLKNSFAILDEAQNATLTQIKMFLTRIGENSKIVVNGDPSQIDLINKSHSGLIKSKKILNKVKEIKIIEFDHKDVVRHPLVTKIIQAFNKNIND